MNVRLNPGLVLLALAALITFIFGALATTGYAAEEGSPEKIPPFTHLTPSPTPTRTPTPSPMPTSPSSQVFNLDEIYYFTPGGGNIGMVCLWDEIKKELPANTRLPVVWTAGESDGDRNLCAYGFPSKRDLTYYLYTPDKKRAAAFTDPAVGGTSAFYGRQEIFNMSQGLPYGTWTVVARGGGFSASTTFEYPPRDYTRLEVTHVMKSEVLHPLDPQWRTGFTQGDEAAVYGIGFRPNSTITVIVARRIKQNGSGEAFRLDPVTGWRVRINSAGHFNIQFPIDRSFKNGDFEVFIKPTSGRTIANVPNTTFRVYSPWRACQSGPLSRLHEGEAARLTAGLANRMRSQPRTSARQVGNIYEYQLVRILDGPKCSGGYTWWYVEVSDGSAGNDGLKGWTAEGNRSGYWLLPIR